MSTDVWSVRAQLAIGGAALGLFVGGALALGPLLGTLVVASVVGVVLLLRTSIEQKVLAYFAVLPLAPWAAVHLPVPALRNLPDLVAAGLLLHLGLAFAAGRLRLPVGHPYVLLVLVYVAFVLVQATNPVIAPTGEGFPGARVYLEPLVLFFAGLATAGSRLFLRRWAVVVVASAVISGLWMLRQVLFGFSASEIAVQQEQAIRTLAEQKVFSTLTSPAVYGFVAGVFLLVCLVARSLHITPRLASVGAALGGVGVVVSGLRISIFGTALAAALVLAVLTKGPDRAWATRAAIVATGTGLVLATLVAVTPVGERDDTFDAANPVEAAVIKLALFKQGSEDENVEGRLRRLGLFLDFVSEHPGGAGPGLVKLVDASVVRDPDTPVPPLPQYILDEPWIFQHDFYYFAVGVELGVVPLLLLIVLLVAVVAMSLKVRARIDDDVGRALLLATAGVATLALVQNLTNESFRNPQVAGYVWFLAAVPVVFSGRGVRLRTDEAASVSR